MRSQLSRVSGSVVVITGASGGIGRATAEAFARAGATVVLAARRPDALATVAAECRRRGGRAEVVPTDVTDLAAVEHLARWTVGHLGRIDTWVNNAGVASVGRLEQTPPDAFRRVIETNLMGTAHGCRAALPHLRRQGHGVIVNVASVAGKFGWGHVAAYSASKHGVVGLSDSLRAELLDARAVHVCTVLPAAIDTPIFQHTANYSGRRITAAPPVSRASAVAAAIVRCATHPRREVPVGIGAGSMRLAFQLAPAPFAWLSTKMTERLFLRPGPTPSSDGNLFAPSGGGSELTGGWLRPRSPAAAAATASAAAAGVPWVAVGAAVAGVGAGLFLLGRRGRRGR